MNTNLRAQYIQAEKELNNIMERAKSEGRDLTPGEAKKAVDLAILRNEAQISLAATGETLLPTIGTRATDSRAISSREVMAAGIAEMYRSGQTQVSDLRELRGAITGGNSAGLIFEPVMGEDYAAKLATPFDLGRYGLILDANTANYSKFPVQSGDLIPNIIGEASAIDSGSLSIGSVPVSLTKYAIIQKVSLEVVEDYPGVWDMIAESAAVGFSTAVTRRVFDRINNTANVQSIDCTAIAASAFGYDNLLQGVRQLEAVNVNPRRIAAAMSPRIAENIGKRKDTTGQYIQPPAKLADIPMLTTSGILETYSSDTATKLYMADWSAVRVIVRGIGAGIVPGNTTFQADPNIPTFSPGAHRVDHTYIATGELGILFYLRCDVIVHRPDNIVIFDNLKF
jgi:HK97 family phage major capsid protein